MFFFERLRIVGKVLPLPIGCITAGSIHSHKVLIQVGTSNIGERIAIRTGTGKTIAQTGSNSQLLDGSEIQIRRATEYKTFTFGYTPVAHDIRIVVIGIAIRRDRIIIAIPVLNQGMSLITIINHLVGQGIRSINHRSQRIKLKGRQHHRAHERTFANRLYMVAAECVVGGEFQPVLYFIIGINGTTDAVKMVFVTDNRTIVIQIRE